MCTPEPPAGLEIDAAPGHGTLALDGHLPERIGDYRVTRLIAMGGMGTVYEAHQESPGRTVALKLLRADLISPSTVRRFEYETEALARLQHPGIAQIYEVGTCSPFGPTQPYFAMELIRGVPITRYAEEHRLDLAARIAMLAAVCDAVHHAHQRGVIHRDLKPANILVDEQGRPKVLDFGVARPIDPDLGATLHTSPGQVLGTLAYMSPEQFEAEGGARPGLGIDTRVDVYSLGVMLFELLTGRHPHPARSGPLLGVVRAIRAGLAERPTHPDAALRGDAGRIVRTAMAPDRDKRYQSVADLASDLRRLLRNEPILARPPSAAYITGRFLRRNRVAVATAAGLALAAGALVGFSFVRISRAEREASRRAEIALATADFLINEVIEELERVGGAGSVNRRLVERILEHSAEFFEQGHDRIPIQENYARLLQQIGTLEQARGRHQESLGRFRTALQIRRRLAELDPGNLDREMEVGLALVRLGDVSLGMGDMETTRRVYTEALAIDERLVAARPGHRRYLDNLGYSYERAAFLAREAGGPADAVGILTRRMELAQEVLRRFPDNQLSALGMCSAHSQVAANARALGDLALAKAEATSAVGYARRLMAASPHHRAYARYAVAALMLAAGADPDPSSAEAAAYLGEALTLALRFAAEDGLVDSWPWEAVGQVHNALAERARRRGDAGATGEHLKGAAEAWTRVVALDPFKPGVMEALRSAMQELDGPR